MAQSCPGTLITPGLTALCQASTRCQCCSCNAHEVAAPMPGGNLVQRRGPFTSEGYWLSYLSELTLCCICFHKFYLQKKALFETPTQSQKGIL